MEASASLVCSVGVTRCYHEETLLRLIGASLSSPGSLARGHVCQVQTWAVPARFPSLWSTCVPPAHAETLGTAPSQLLECGEQMKQIGMGAGSGMGA